MSDIGQNQVQAGGGKTNHPLGDTSTHYQNLSQNLSAVLPQAINQIQNGGGVPNLPVNNQQTSVPQNSMPVNNQPSVQDILSGLNVSNTLTPNVQSQGQGLNNSNNSFPVNDSEEQLLSRIFGDQGIQSPQVNNQNTSVKSDMDLLKGIVDGSITDINAALEQQKGTGQNQQQGVGDQGQNQNQAGNSNEVKELVGVIKDLIIQGQPNNFRPPAHQQYNPQNSNQNNPLAMAASIAGVTPDEINNLDDQTKGVVVKILNGVGLMEQNRQSTTQREREQTASMNRFYNEFNKLSSEYNIPNDEHGELLATVLYGMAPAYLQMHPNGTYADMYGGLKKAFVPSTNEGLISMINGLDHGDRLAVVGGLVKSLRDSGQAAAAQQNTAPTSFVPSNAVNFGVPEHQGQFGVDPNNKRPTSFSGALDAVKEKLAKAGLRHLLV